MTPSTRVSTDGTARSSGGLRQSFGHAWLIVRVEHLRRYRRMRVNRRNLVIGLVFGGLLFLLLIAGGVGGAYVFGTAVGTDAFAEQLSLARTVLAGIAVAVAVLVALRTGLEYGELDEPTPVLTAIPYREVVWGLLLLTSSVFVALAFVPILAVAVAFAIGAGSVASIPVITVVLLAMIVFATIAGFVLGQLLKLIGGRITFIARYKTLIGILALVAYFAVLVSGIFEDLFGVDWTVFGATPLGWITDLALVTVSGASIGIARPVVAAVTLLAGTALLTWLAVRLSGVLWYTDPVQPTDDTTDRDTASTGATNGLSAGLSERLFGGRISRSTLRIAQKSWRRGYRAPITLQFAAWPVFVLVGPVRQSIEAGEVSTVLPISIAIYGAWASGAAFTLNPLGDEGAVLPITLVSGIRGAQLLHGLMFAGVAIGGPLTVVLATAVGLASPMGMFSVIMVGILGGVLCVGGCAIGVGVGTAFPKFERMRLGRSYKAVVPGMLAFGVYSLVFFVVLLPGLFSGVPLLTQWLSGQVGVSAQIIALVGLAGTTLLAGVAGWIGLRSAGRTIDGYTLVR